MSSKGPWITLGTPHSSTEGLSSDLLQPEIKVPLSAFQRHVCILYGMGLAVIATRPTLISENILADCPP